MKRVLVVVDMQTDFVDGALGTKEAVAIVPAVKARLEQARMNGEEVIFTRDTHPDNYLETQEGRNLPVVHCVKGSQGWQIVPQLTEFTQPPARIIDKPTFGSSLLGQMLQEENQQEGIGEIEVIGLCTDICVISNALLIKAFLPEVPIAVDPALCAGVTPQSHENALKAMASCQIRIL